MNVDEARGVCKDRNRWLAVVSAYMGKRREFMYVCWNTALSGNGTSYQIFRSFFDNSINLQDTQINIRHTFPKRFRL